MNKLKSIVARIISRIFGKNTVFYINGPVHLPPPLDKDTELNLVKLSESGDTSAREQLIVHNLRLVVYIARRFDVKGASIEDLISIGTIGLLKAVKTFKSDKNIKIVYF